MLRVALVMATLSTGPASSTATDPGRFVPPNADRALVTPAAGTGAAEALALLTVAGARAPLLGPASLGGGWEHSLSLNPFDPASLKAAGVAENAPLAVATIGQVELLVFGAGDAAAARAHLDGWLAAQGGTVSTISRGGLSIRVAWVGSRAAAAFAFHGDRVAAALAGERGGDPVAIALSALTGKKTLARVAEWKAQQFGSAPWKIWMRIQGRGGPLVAALSRRGTSELTATGRIGLPSPDLLPKDQAAAGVPDVPGALGVVRMRLNGGGPLADALAWLLARACPSCDPALRKSYGSRLSALAAGPAVLAIDGIDLHAVAGGHTGMSAFPTVWALPVNDQEKAAAVAREIAAKLGASAGEGANWSTPSPDGRVFFGVASGLAYLATDPGARDRDLPSLATPGATGPGSPFVARIHPSALGRALSRVSALDALSGGALAGLFAAKLEIGSFLEGAGPLLIDARPSGKDVYAFDLAWNLAP